VLGEHKGLAYFTIGQRQGLGVGGFEDPVYVTGMNLDTHDLIVGPRTSLGRNVIFLEDINWVAPDKVGERIPLWARIRSASSLIPATFFPDEKRIVLEVPEYGVAPGQACVFYDQHRMLGGGWIAKSERIAS
jgi:tRNA-specific 2-thiouridylase